MVKNRPEIDWQGTWRAAEECGARRMLGVGLSLSARVLGAPLPVAIADEIRRDKVCERLCAEIETWLPFGTGAPASLLRRALYRVHMGGGGLSGLSYLSRLSLSPTEEDWQDTRQKGRSRLWDALRRPFRLMRKYGSDD
jgi:hypothetical protein